MPLTASGTSYTVYTATIPGLGRCRWIIADNAVGRADVPALLYAHGANGGVGSFSGGSSWTLLRDWWMDIGGVVIEGEGGAPDASGVTFNHWGNQMNRDAYMAYFGHVAAIVDIGIVVPVGSSMGGLITKWLATRSPIAYRCPGLLSFAGVGTLFVGDYDTVPGNTPTNITQQSARYFTSTTGIAAAYGASSYDQLVTLAADHAPENWTPNVWAGKRILEMYADNDIAVPWWPRGSSRLREIRAGQPQADIAELHTGLTVGHDLSTGVGMHFPVVQDFLTGLLPAPEPQPDPKNAFVARWGYTRRAGKLYPIRSIGAS